MREGIRHCSGAFVLYIPAEMNLFFFVPAGETAAHLGSAPPIAHPTTDGEKETNPLLVQF